MSLKGERERQTYRGKNTFARSKTQ